MLKSSGKKEMGQITRNQTEPWKPKTLRFPLLFQQVPFDILHFLDNIIKNLREELPNFSVMTENLSFVTFPSLNSTRKINVLPAVHVFLVQIVSTERKREREEGREEGSKGGKERANYIDELGMAGNIGLIH